MGPSIRIDASRGLRQRRVRRKHENREQKAEAISESLEGIVKATNAFLLDFKGITVPQVTELREQVRETRPSYGVIKNTLAQRRRRILRWRSSPSSSPADSDRVQHDDPVALAKVLTKFAKDVPTFSSRGRARRPDYRRRPRSQAGQPASRKGSWCKLLFLLQRPSAQTLRRTQRPPQPRRRARSGRQAEGWRPRNRFEV